MSEIKGYAKGVALLTIAALFVKVLSMVYRIPFQNLVGDQGFFIYQQVYPFVAIFMTWTSSGLAIAVSKMLVDESNQNFGRQGAVAQLLYRSLVVGAFVLFILMYGFSDVFAQAMGDPQLASLLKIGSFVIFTTPVLAMYKGSLQAKGNLKVVATIQVMEQLARVAIILGGTAYVMATSKSLYLAGEIAVLGTVAGEVIGAIALVLYMRKSKQYTPLLHSQQALTAKRDLIKKMIVVSLSASMSSLLLILFQLVDSFTVFDTLMKHAMTKIEAMEEKGIYDRGQPLVQVGLVIATSLSLAVVPMIAHAMKSQRTNKINFFIRVTYQATLLFAVAAAVGLILVMPYLNKTLFETADLSKVLQVYVLQIIMLSIVMAMTAVLQGLGYRKWPTYILAISLLIKIILNEVLVFQLGIVGAAWSSNIALLMGALGLIYYVKRVLDIKLASFQFYKTTALATLVMYSGAELFIYFEKQLTILPLEGRSYAAVMLLLITIIGASLFIVWITKFKILTIKEWLLLPMGNKMAALQLFLNKK
ncbi:MAG: polysaccharide biosynthesis protein [Kurthia sp.]|nr:polysaccharide biosynthesis protein [Candidatus Kurthia equi]